MRRRIANVLSWLASVVAGHKRGREVAVRLIKDRPDVFVLETPIHTCDRARLIYR